jgi:hypothetical protein
MNEEEIETWYEDQKQAIAKLYLKEMDQYKAKGETNMKVMKAQLVVIEGRFHVQFKKLHEQYEKMLTTAQMDVIRKEKNKILSEKIMKPLRVLSNKIKDGFSEARDTFILRKKQIRRWWIEKGRRATLRPMWLAYDRYLMYWHPIRNWNVIHMRPPSRIVLRPFIRTVNFIIGVIMALVHLTINLSLKVFSLSVKVGKTGVTKGSVLAKKVTAWTTEISKKISDIIKSVKEKLKPKPAAA